MNGFLSGRIFRGDFLIIFLIVSVSQERLFVGYFLSILVFRVFFKERVLGCIYISIEFFEKKQICSLVKVVVIVFVYNVGKLLNVIFFWEVFLVYFNMQFIFDQKGF